MNDLQTLPLEKRSVSKLILGNIRTLMIALILFTVIVVMTTDIKLVTISSITDLGLEFFIILVSSYMMYVCCADGGIERGFKTSTYIESKKRYDELKAKIEENYIEKMGEFCEDYIAEELKRSRKKILSSACISYEEYEREFLKLSPREVRALTTLTERQKTAVIKASKLRRIRLTPDMLLTQSRTGRFRSPLAYSPEACKNLTFGAKFIKMALMSACMTLIALDIIIEPSWTVFAQVCLKLVTVVINGVDGDKEGFRNIAVHSVNYTNAQAQLMLQAINYAEKN